MKWLVCSFTICTILAAADQPAKPAQPAARTAAKPAPKKAPPRMTVPPGAVQVSPGLYRWTDKEGKGWMYRSTPFGVSRWPQDEADTKQTAGSEHTTAVEQGDSIRFQRSTPFGKRTWVRKKTELDETERQIWAHQQARNAAGRKAEKE
jgi:hypothetical protein